MTKSNGRHVAFFMPSLMGGGVERVLLRLAIGFAERGCKVDLVVAKAQRSAEGSYLAQVPENVRVVDLGHSRILLSLPGFVAYLRREKPDALLSGMEHVNLITIWAKLLAGVDTRVVIGVHNTESVCREGSAFKRRLIRASLKRFWRYADGIVAVSKGVADDYAPYMDIPREAIRVIYNPAIAPAIAQQACAEPRHPWFVEKTTPLIVSAGRLTTAKNHRILIQAMTAVHAQTGARLVIIGEGPERARLTAQINLAGLEKAVDMPGFSDNPFSYMKHADAFVLCSAWEGLPTVLIEALYLGTPVVSTECPSGPAEILEGGKWGRLVPVDDAGALAQAIVETLRKPQRNLAVERAANFSVSNIISEYADALCIPIKR
ncbi:MAG: glycosyltransferase [Elusimicrobiota bacterium]|jgi:glycosyltransferase involved in cell wall biosynthesis